MLSISITVLSEKKLMLVVSDFGFEQKYKNKYEISFYIRSIYISIRDTDNTMSNGEKKNVIILMSLWL